MDTPEDSQASNGQASAGEPSDEEAKHPDAFDEKSSHLVIGWREWVSLPELGIPAIKAKVDTGARTSAIHAFDIERINKKGGEDWLAFSIQPIQRNDSIVVRAEAPLVDVRTVTDSGGHKADRFFIETLLKVGPHERRIEMTLTRRHDMLFRMLLGRTAMVPDIQIDPSQSFSLGRMSTRSLYADQITGVDS